MTTHINYVKGEEPQALDVATDTTSMSTQDVRVIFNDTGLTRDEAAEALERIRMAILDGRRAWPLAT